MLMPNRMPLLTQSTMDAARWDPPRGALDQIRELLPILRLRRPNLLLIGRNRDLEAVLQHLRPWLCAPLVHWSPAEALPLPTTPIGTLVVKDAAHLDLEQQARLIAWCADTPGAQVVSMASVPLFPLVAAGAFHDDLYYQLNMVMLDLTTRGRHAKRIGISTDENEQWRNFAEGETI